MTPERKTCPDCGAGYWNHIGYHSERCPGPPTQPVREIAEAIAEEQPFTDMDAIRVARAFLEATA